MAWFRLRDSSQFPGVFPIPLGLLHYIRVAPLGMGPMGVHLHLVRLGKGGGVLYRVTGWLPQSGPSWGAPDPLSALAVRTPGSLVAMVFCQEEPDSPTAGLDAAILVEADVASF